MGWVTPEYALIRAAKYLGVPPWELAQQPRFWHEKALLYERIEGEAQQERERRAAPSAN
jgi:hypothetical protein